MPDDPHFAPAALTFLRQLRKHNDRDWFTPRKAEFESLLRDPMLALAGSIGDDLRAFAVDHVRPPEKAVHRIYRDVRFSKNKDPYKTNVSAMFPRAGLGKMAGGGYYVSVSPDGVEIAAGVYGPGPAELAAIRADVDRDPARIERLAADPKLVKRLGPMQGEQLVRVPKPYPADHAAADLLRRKQFFFFVMLDADTATKPGLRKAVVDRFRTAAPFVDHLNGVLLAAARADGSGEDDRPKRPKPMF